MTDNTLIIICAAVAFLVIVAVPLAFLIGKLLHSSLGAPRTIMRRLDNVDVHLDQLETVSADKNAVINSLSSRIDKLESREKQSRPAPKRVLDMEEDR